jgi:hypothetical protein
MSDYARSTLAFPLMDARSGSAVERLFRVLEATTDGSDLLIRTFAERPDQYVRQEGADWPSVPPDQIAEVAVMHTNLAVHTALVLGGSSYGCSVLAFKIGGSTNDAPKTFVRISFPSALTGALRGTREFGAPIRVDATIKSDLLGLAVRTAKGLSASGFALGPEVDGWQPFTVDAFERYLQDPMKVPAPMPFWYAGCDDGRVSRADLLRTWQPDAPLLRLGRFNILDALQALGDQEDEGEAS